MGRKAAYVRNIEADARVRVRVRGRWRTGTAQVLDDEDPRARLRSISRLNAPACARWGPTCSSCGSTSTRSRRAGAPTRLPHAQRSGRSG